MPQQFNKLPTDDDHLNRVQENIRIAVDPLSNDFLLNRVEKKDVTIRTTGTTVQHNLGRMPRGWIITDKTDYPSVWRTAVDATNFVFYASADCIVSFIFF